MATPIILTSLPIEGGTTVGNAEKFYNFIPILNPQGQLDSSFIPIIYSPFNNQSVNFTAVVGNTYGINTTNISVFCTTPINPIDGDWFRIFDIAKKWNVHSVVVGSYSSSFVIPPISSIVEGNYLLNSIPPIGAGIITFVWSEILQAWSVN